MQIISLLYSIVKYYFYIRSRHSIEKAGKRSLLLFMFDYPLQQTVVIHCPGRDGNPRFVYILIGQR